MIRAGVVGATGYTGAELLRLLIGHSEVEIVQVTSRSEQGRPVADLFPGLSGELELSFVAPDPVSLKQCDVVFFATPHGVAQGMMSELAGGEVRVIDLSADFRIRDIAIWEKWYGQQHQAPDLVAGAVYGLPELNREQIASASLVAAPGCYPTSIELGFLPLLKNNLVDCNDLVASSASGVSGAGRQAKVDNLFAEMGESFKAYAVPGHRHLPEIVQVLEEVAKTTVGLTFVPHLLPVTRGIHSTLFANLLDNSVNLQQLYEDCYRDEPFVEVLPSGSHPQTRVVRGTNNCQIAVHQPGANKAVVLVTEDNLTKGAAGQAVQCMNIMFGLDETVGLRYISVLP
jgi:N-acetyl-gamma-glutamyl-phosphate reductase